MLLNKVSFFAVGQRRHKTEKNTLNSKQCFPANSPTQPPTDFTDYSQHNQGCNQKYSEDAEGGKTYCSLWQ